MSGTAVAPPRDRNDGLVTARSATATTSEPAAGPPEAVPRGLGRARTAAMLVPVSVSALLTASVLARPGALAGVHGYLGFGYDDGAHLATALDLTRLSLPYRDYVFLHPPGITVLLLPLAIVGRVLGEGAALVLGRIVVLAVSAANVALVAWLVRRRGALAMYVAGLTLALWPLASDVTRTLMSEPFVLLLTLLGTAVLSPLEGRPTSRRALLGGVLFGLAIAVRLLAVLPAVALLVWCVVALRDRLRPVALGMVAGFGVVVLPFAVLAPAAFVDQVVVAQLHRVPVGDPAGLAERLTMLVGVAVQPSREQAGLAVVVVLAVVGLVVVAFVARRRVVAGPEWLLLMLAIATTIGATRTPETFEQYWYVPVAFLATVLGPAVALLVGMVPVRHRGVGLRWLVGLGVVATASVLAVPLAAHDHELAGRYVGAADDPGPFVRSLVPAGSCAVSDVVTILVVADRYGADGCPVVVDPFGMYLVADGHAPPSRVAVPPPELTAWWRGTLGAADSVVLSADGSNFLAWTPEQRAWFDRTFTKVGTRGRVVVYRRAVDG